LISSFPISSAGSLEFVAASFSTGNALLKWLCSKIQKKYLLIDFIKRIQVFFVQTTKI